MTRIKFIELLVNLKETRRLCTGVNIYSVSLFVMYADTLYISNGFILLSLYDTTFASFQIKQRKTIKQYVNILVIRFVLLYMLIYPY